MSNPMIIDELCKIPFRCTAHMSAASEHTCTFWNEEYGIGFCEHQPYDSHGNPCGHRYTHYCYRMRVYKSARAFLAAYNKEKSHFIDEHKSKDNEHN